MRNMSFALTRNQILNRTKFVTRRLGWRFLKGGDLVQACFKCQGLKKGEHPEKLAVIRIRYVTTEMLYIIIKVNGPRECILEGFPELTPTQFMEMFCRHNKCTPYTIVTRIEFEYVD